jgi:hypothetical protein
LPLLPSACLSALLQLLSLALRIACFMVFVLCILSDMVFLLFFSKQIFNRVLHAPLYRSDKGYQRSRQLLSTGAVLIMWETFILTLSHSKTVAQGTVPLGWYALNVLQFVGIGVGLVCF